MVKKKAAETVPAEHSGQHNIPQAKSKAQSDSKTAKHALAAAADAKPASAGKKRAKDEIDAIFRSQKQKTETKQGQKYDGQQPPSQDLQEMAKQVAEKAKPNQPRLQGSKDDIFGEQIGKARKRTEEGYAIYGEDELGLGKKGGDTPLCPFDCDCCY